jgi:phosphoserine aminotransferase
MKKHNFSPGPSILPQEVFQKASQAVLDFNGKGLSILEISHRSKDFIAVMENAQRLVKKLAGLNDDYEVLFLQGGASLQFLMVAYNLLTEKGKAAYIDTGAWSAAAIKEAKKLGTIEVIASSKDKNYAYLPKNIEISNDFDYVHFTSNNTIFGTQFKEFPQTKIPLVCDMSSDIFSRKLDFSQLGLIYAGAQKNLGPAGVAIIIIKKELLGKTNRNIPSYLDYQVHIEKESMFNTPPVFATYVTMLTLEWLDNLGGIEAIEKINQEKAAILYAEIDRNSMFKGVVDKEDRSLMNVTFVLTDETKKEEFNQLWKVAGIDGLEGHRSVGGYRASIYNAMPKESVQVLVDAMKEFEVKFG